MKEFPVFVPWDGEHLAAVVAVPDGPVRGLVVLATVPGSPRSHRYQTWAVAAEHLSGLGMASVRFEFSGLDDSTGTATEVSMAETPLDQISAVTRFAQRATGAERVVAAGNCLGAQAALSLAGELPECMGAVCMLPRVLRSGSVRGLVERASGGRLRAMLRSSHLVRRILARRLGRFDLRIRPQVRDPLLRALEHARVVFVYDQVDHARRSRAFPMVRTVVDRLPESHRRRFELVVLPTRGLERFATIECQEAAIDLLVDWADRCLPAEESPISATPGSAVGSVSAGLSPVPAVDGPSPA